MGGRIHVTDMILATTKSAQPRMQSSNTSVPTLTAYGSRAPPRDSGDGGIASLDAIVGTGLSAAPANGGGGDENTEEELFALPMSPRSPEMKKSPFSLL